MNITDQVTILLVEDNDFDAELTLRALNQYNLANQILRVSDGKEALNFLLHANAGESGIVTYPKLILLDLKLPDMDGLDVLRVLKTDPKTKCIPIVVLTSSTQDEDINRCYELGVNSFISKPVEFDRFIQTMSSLGMYWLLLNKAP